MELAYIALSKSAALAAYGFDPRDPYHKRRNAINRVPALFCFFQTSVFSSEPRKSQSSTFTTRMPS